MSNGYDFFGGPVAPARSQQPGGATAVDRFGMPAAPPLSAFPPGPSPEPPAAKSKTPLLVIGALVLVAVLAAAGYFYVNRSHSVSMPQAAAGLPALTHLPKAQRDQVKSVEDQLRQIHVHDAAARVYGDLNGDEAVLAVAGHFDTRANVDMQTWSDAFTKGVEAAGMRFTASEVMSGATSFECVSQAATTQAPAQLSICYWWSQDSLVVGVGLGVDAQQVADSLQAVKSHARLR